MSDHKGPSQLKKIFRIKTQSRGDGSNLEDLLHRMGKSKDHTDEDAYGALRAWLTVEEALRILATGHAMNYLVSLAPQKAK